MWMGAVSERSPEGNDLYPANILLVEDNRGDVVLLSEAMHELSVPSPLHVAQDGVEALSFLRKQPPFERMPVPDLIILDLNLPRMDGRGVLRNLTGSDDLRKVPLVVLTSSRSDYSVIDEFNLPQDCYFVKPAVFTGYLETVQAILDFYSRQAMGN
jgi:two-component system, chemotaxis family, response regulator Rcp1